MIGTRYEHRDSGVIWEIYPNDMIKCVRQSNYSPSVVDLGESLPDDHDWSKEYWIETPPKESTFDKLYLTLKQ